MHDEIKISSNKVGKAQWWPLIAYMIDMHEGAIHAPVMDVPYRWEESAPGGSLGIFFGSWDTVHIALDCLHLDFQHAIHQIVNLLTLQQQNGLIPAHVRFTNGKFSVGKKVTFPPLWPFVIERYLTSNNNLELISNCLSTLEKQIVWFENHRKTSSEGFYYLDYMDNLPESGVEGSIRFELGDDIIENYACVDASSHVYALYEFAISWGKLLNKDVSIFEDKAKELKAFIQENLFDSETGFFHDQWSVKNPKLRKLTFEGIWPLVCGAATSEQAHRVINENLLEANRFFTPHPIPTAAIHEPFFGTCKWHGPVRNSMTYWAARGCIKHNRIDAAKNLLEKALDCTAHQFEKTATLWEFYHPDAGNPLALQQRPSNNHLGHNPILAMVHLWQSCL